MGRKDDGYRKGYITTLPSVVVAGLWMNICHKTILDSILVLGQEAQEKVVQMDTLAMTFYIQRVYALALVLVNSVKTMVTTHE